MAETSSSSTGQDENRQAFLSYLPERIEAFEQRIRRYSKGGWDHAGMLVLRGDVQRLADTSGRHEMAETQQHLRKLEESLGDHILRMSRPTQPQAAAMLELLSSLSASLPRLPESRPATTSAARSGGSNATHAGAQTMPAGAAVRAEPAVLFEPDEPAAPVETGLRRIYHLSDDNDFAKELGRRLGSEGYAVETFATFNELFGVVLCLLPHVILLDSSRLPDLKAVGDLRREAQQNFKPQRHIHLVAMAAKGDMGTRRQAHKAGVDLLLVPPVDVDDSVSRVLALHASAPEETVRVLIVEDNRADAFYAQTVLAKAGMQAYVEHDPRRVIESLEVLHPDLVLMDLHMPHANGVEVTMLIRKHPVFARLPIVFLSGESDPDSQLEASNAGGDDFLFKPIRPQRLIAAVRDRMRHLHPVRKKEPA
ncbi:MAG TPA: response regulator [Xanthomonadaceae bacterium]|jgi:DNA-binding response OmpR family regulator